MRRWTFEIATLEMPQLFHLRMERDVGIVFWSGWGSIGYVETGEKEPRWIQLLSRFHVSNAGLERVSVEKGDKFVGA